MIRNKIAVVGTGSIGLRHLKVLESLGLQSWAVPKRESRLDALKNQGFAVASSLAEAARQGATFAIIASNTSLHADNAKQALELGMDLLVEKPFAVDQKAALSVFEMAQKLERQIYVACVLRFSDALRAFREWLPRIGTVYSVRIECQSYLPDWRPGRDYRESYSAKKEEGGVLLDLIHEIDYATWIFGWPATLTARLENFGVLGIEAEEWAELFWQTEQKVRVSLCLDYLSRIPRRTMTAFGSNGQLAWDGIRQQVRLELAGQAMESSSFPVERDGIYRAQLMAFLDRGSESPLATAQEGVRALGICDAARLSSQTRKEQTVNYLT
ncbi:MAG: Gfo/Idh/MocA family oxidoreductase [Deltaproteobacteria bacterium]|nr:Gfo/Idh/MocA family oxidoreductase [Deltaproteobacteria bacterium]